MFCTFVLLLQECPLHFFVLTSVGVSIILLYTYIIWYRPVFFNQAQKQRNSQNVKNTKVYGYFCANTWKFNACHNITQKKRSVSVLAAKMNNNKLAHLPRCHFSITAELSWYVYSSHFTCEWMLILSFPAVEKSQMLVVLVFFLISGKGA